MRNTTKLKAILLNYSVTFDMDDDGIITLILTDKDFNLSEEFQSRSYSTLISKAYSHFLKELKKKEKPERE